MLPFIFPWRELRNRRNKKGRGVGALGPPRPAKRSGVGEERSFPGGLWRKDGEAPGHKQPWQFFQPVGQRAGTLGTVQSSGIAGLSKGKGLKNLFHPFRGRSSVYFALLAWEGLQDQSGKNYWAVHHHLDFSHIILIIAYLLLVIMTRAWE